jgi:hypothetical protein
MYPRWQVLNVVTAPEADLKDITTQRGTQSGAIWLDFLCVARLLGNHRHDVFVPPPHETEVSRNSTDPSGPSPVSNPSRTGPKDGFDQGEVPFGAPSVRR